MTGHRAPRWYSAGFFFAGAPATMRLSLRLPALMVLAFLVAGCGWMNAREGDDYRDARAGKTLAIPEGLDAPRDTAALTIPETSGGKNQTDVSDSPPSVALNSEPIVPVPSQLPPDEAFAKVESALRGTSGFVVIDVQPATRTLKVRTTVAQARRTWWSRLTGREKIDQVSSTRTLSVLGASGGSAVTIRDAAGDDDAASRRILAALRQALR